MQAAPPASAAAGQPGAAAPAPSPAAPAGLEEGCDDDLFLQLAAAAEEDDDAGAATGGGSGAVDASQQPSKSSSSGGPRLSWAAKTATAGIGAVPPGRKPRQAVLLAPGAIPRVAPPPPSALLLPPASQAAAAPGSRVVATFGAQAGPAAAAGGAAAKGGFADVGQGSLVERYAGLKIKNPRVSHTQLRGRLADTAVMKLSHVRQRHRTAGLEGSWATICVIGEKSRPRETASGRPYSIWKVTDLDQTCVSLFLFSGAHDDLWREAEGTIVALFSPKVRADGEFSLSVDSADQANATVCISVDSADQVWVLGQSPEFGHCCLYFVPAADWPLYYLFVQVWVLGQSPEFGHCKATKKNGEPCRMPVNAARCPFCPYHVQTEYNKLKPTQRNEFQGSNLKTAFRPGMQRGLQWAPGEFETAGAKAQRVKSFGASQLEGLASNARNRGSAAGARYLSTVANPAAVAAAEAAAQHRLTPAAAIAAAAKLGPAAAALAAAPIPAGRSGGALVLELPQAGGKRKAAAAALGRGAAAGAGGSKRRASGGAGGSSAAASLGAGDGGLMEIELDDDEDESAELALAGSGGGGSGFDPTAAARQRAIELLRAAGGAKAPDPNSSGKVPDALAASVRRMDAERRSSAGTAGTAGDVEQPGPSSGGRQALGQVQPGARQQAQQAQQRKQQQQHKPPPIPSVVAGGAGAARPPNTATRPAAAAAAAAAGGSSRSGQPASAARPKPTAAKAAAAAPRSAMEAAFGAVVGDEAAAAAAAAKGTRYKDLVDDEEHKKLDKVLTALETKDEIAARMDSTKNLKVQAFRCKLCNYTAERRRPECAAHPYAVERMEVTKRWWQCGGCRYRFATLGQRYPHSRCTKCNEPTEFTAVSMFRPQAERAHEKEQSGIASRANLLARGSEQKWANSW
ncbi:MCM10-like protein [Chlorella sorokiniana]|uniref:Protein MCM10 homolog n=1 Tax=Chlorella sorokiniana TaxID=3076 RepID=A0A2P6U283_CHLSO|nr:MCM10-like protein [Chlorella sorokiniana]|eukprot:PRW60422.1 MCM10-like protein [Chlorella sorokiniana]